MILSSLCPVCLFMRCRCSVLVCLSVICLACLPRKKHGFHVIGGGLSSLLFVFCRKMSVGPVRTFSCVFVCMARVCEMCVVLLVQ
jgi:hypothetical protein